MLVAEMDPMGPYGGGPGKTAPAANGSGDSNGFVAAGATPTYPGANGGAAGAADMNSALASIGSAEPAKNTLWYEYAKRLSLSCLC